MRQGRYMTSTLPKLILHLQQHQSPRQYLPTFLTSTPTLVSQQKGFLVSQDTQSNGSFNLIYTHVSSYCYICFSRYAEQCIIQLDIYPCIILLLYLFLKIRRGMYHSTWYIPMYHSTWYIPMCHSTILTCHSTWYIPMCHSTWYIPMCHSTWYIPTCHSTWYIHMCHSTWYIPMCHSTWYITMCHSTWYIYTHVSFNLIYTHVSYYCYILF